MNKFQEWYYYNFKQKFNKITENFVMWIVWYILPYKVRYWTVIRAWNDATVGEFENVEVPSVLVVDMLNRMK